MTDAVGEPGGGEWTAEAGWFLGHYRLPLEIRGQVVDQRVYTWGGFPKS